MLQECGQRLHGSLVFRALLGSPRKVWSKWNKHVLKKFFVMLWLKIYWITFYPTLHLFSMVIKAVQLNHQRDKEVRRLVSTSGRPTKLQNSVAVCQKTLFPETKWRYTVRFIENFAGTEVGHCSRAYLLSGKFLPRAKRYTHREKEKKKKEKTGLIIKTLTHP